MIYEKKDLKYFLECDKVALHISETRNKPKLFFDYIWKFEIALRHSEYYYNQNSTLFNKMLYYFWYFRFKKLGSKLNIELWLNQFGPGLSIAHGGCIIVNGNAKIGDNCRLHEGVTIGATNGESEAAKIGDNVFIGTGAKIIGKVTIADGCAIGANAVVINDVLDKNVSVAGVPAKIASHNGSGNNLVRATEIVRRK